MVLMTMLEDKLKSIKEFINSYIETYQTCLNITNTDFILNLVKSSTEMQEAFVKRHDETYANVNLKAAYGLDEKQLKAENEMKKQLFKLISCDLNDLDESIDKSKQVKMYRILTSSYFEFIRKNVRDFVPKRIQHKMINDLLDDFEYQLHEHVFTQYVNNRSFEVVLVEEKGIIKDRKRAEQLLDAVNRALENMTSIQCY